MKKFWLAIISLLLLGLAAGALAGCSAENSSKLKVVTSTSLMEYIVEQVGGDLVEATNLVPPNQHPGNFDVKPGDVQNLADARLFLLHGWPGEGYADKMIESAGNPGLVVIRAGVDGNWMIPSIQEAAVEKVMSALVEIDSENAAEYQKAADDYIKTIQDVETDILDRLAAADISGINVIASVRQADFLKWAGLNVVGSFMSPQELTPQRVRELVDSGTAENVVLVVNNLQDSQDAGQSVARELRVTNLNLSNFPGGFTDTETWEKAIRYNVDILLESLR